MFKIKNVFMILQIKITKHRFGIHFSACWTFNPVAFFNFKQCFFTEVTDNMTVLNEALAVVGFLVLLELLFSSSLILFGD